MGSKHERCRTMIRAGDRLGRIRAIDAAGEEVDIWILRRQLKPSEYSTVEAALIDLLSVFPIATIRGARRTAILRESQLTNKVRGSGWEFGIARLSDIERDFAAPDLATDVPLLLVTLGPWVDQEDPLPGGDTRAGHGFKPEWTDRKVLNSQIDELGPSVCCWWVIDRTRVANSGIKHMVAV